MDDEDIVVEKRSKFEKYLYDRITVKFAALFLLKNICRCDHVRTNGSIRLPPIANRIIFYKDRFGQEAPGGNRFP